MQNDKPSLIEIERRICELQKSYVSLQETLKEVQNAFECHMDDAVLRLIDILDLINITKMDINDEASLRAQCIINKIEKRMADILKHWHVQEIAFIEGQIAVGKARVVERRKILNNQVSGTIIEVCRRGYQRKDRIIRPADVITAE